MKGLNKMKTDKLKIGEPVRYKGKVYSVLGFAASTDSKGRKLIEIAWNDFDASITGYLAVERAALMRVPKGIDK